MHPDFDSFSRRLDERLSRVQAWVRARRDAGARDVERLHARLEALRRDLRQGTADAAHHALARARADVADMGRDGGPASPIALRGEELHALTHHLQLTASLLPQLSNLDDPGWRAAHEKYERSWDEVHHAFEEGDTAAR